MRFIPVAAATILVMVAVAVLVINQNLTLVWMLLWMSMTILFLDQALLNRQLFKLIHIQNEQVATLLEFPQKQQALIDDQLAVIQALRQQIDDLSHVSRN